MSLHYVMRAQNAEMRFSREKGSEQTLFDAKQEPGLQQQIEQETDIETFFAHRYPLTSYFTATVRGGSPPSDTLELLGHRQAMASMVSYARVRLG